jgi:hypothetical protein
VVAAQVVVVAVVAAWRHLPVRIPRLVVAKVAVDQWRRNLALLSVPRLVPLKPFVKVRGWGAGRYLPGCLQSGRVLPLVRHWH